MKSKPELQVSFDRKQAFLLYATFTGDVERTAHALSVSPTTILRVADEEHWNDKLRSIIELKKSERPGDLERAINRAVNFVQAHRMRLFVERILQRLTDMNEQELEQYLFSSEVVGKQGDVSQIAKLNTRPIADLLSACEKCHALSYMALSDTATERVKRQEAAGDKGEVAASEMHAKIASAMNAVAGSNSPRAMLFDAQLHAAEQAKAEAAKEKSAKPNPANPYNEDS